MNAARNSFGFFLLALLFVFFKFWFMDAPLGILKYGASLNSAFLQLFSLPLFLRTFFKPLKNEYRQGLVGFSIGMGIALKTVLIGIDLVLFLFLIIFELIACMAFYFLPVAAIILIVL